MHELNSRQRLRMAAHPLLQLIHHQMQQRQAAGGSIRYEHVRAHSTGADMPSVGNRLADFKANAVRTQPQTATPATVREIPLAECEHRLTAWAEHGAGMQIIDFFFFSIVMAIVFHKTTATVNATNSLSHAECRNDTRASLERQ